ncbi:hypothetical protein LUZ61_014523 [Rhynchospora tenuis]|uniref:Uncharacterized protein n=1 Tax=Rhynchospora tenuis TaxID=198213 RepID=A0AAD5Z398_9POAL|nr:hypothetical protein LUZ61_014523 [Rhynchospora tenuis]
MRDLPPLNLSSLMLSNCPLWEDLPFLAQMPHLKKLSLLGMSEVKQIDFSFDSTKNAYAFPSLEHLICDEMPKWQSWAGLLSCHGFPNLGVLKVTNCPNLTKLPVMPLSLFYFKVENVGLNSLPDIYHNYSITTPSPSYPKSSLTEVILRYCPNLKSMNGFLQQENLDFQAVEILVIYNSENLVQLPTSAFGIFVSLKYLYIRGCPKLVPADNQRILLPVKLQTLIIGDCGELDVTVLESSSQLATLTTLRIIDSPTITYIPCSDNAFPSLSELHIQGCDKLVQHSLMKNEHGVNLVKSVTSLKINELNIPHHSLLSIEPLRSLRFVKMCRVVNCSGMEALPEQWLMQNSNTLKILTIENASSLRSLPDTMVRLTALKRLRIKNATLLEHIPELPPSLVQTSITDAGGRELV